jgi:hypothetical protein
MVRTVRASNNSRITGLTLHGPATNSNKLQGAPTQKQKTTPPIRLIPDKSRPSILPHHAITTLRAATLESPSPIPTPHPSAAINPHLNLHCKPLSASPTFVSGVFAAISPRSARAVRSRAPPPQKPPPLSLYVRRNSTRSSLFTLAFVQI